MTPVHYTSLLFNPSVRFIIIFCFKSFFDEPDILFSVFTSEFYISLYLNIYIHIDN